MTKQFKILSSGYRVAWKKPSLGSRLCFTVYFPALEDAERRAEELRRSGEYVSAIEYKEQ